MNMGLRISLPREQRIRSIINVIVTIKILKLEEKLKSYQYNYQYTDKNSQLSISIHEY